MHACIDACRGMKVPARGSPLLQEPASKGFSVTFHHLPLSQHNACCAAGRLTQAACFWTHCRGCMQQQSATLPCWQSARSSLLQTWMATLCPMRCTGCCSRCPSARYDCVNIGTAQFPFVQTLCVGIPVFQLPLQCAACTECNVPANAESTRHCSTLHLQHTRCLAHILIQ